MCCFALIEAAAGEKRTTEAPWVFGSMDPRSTGGGGLTPQHMVGGEGPPICAYVRAWVGPAGALHQPWSQQSSSSLADGHAPQSTMHGAASTDRILRMSEGSLQVRRGSLQGTLVPERGPHILICMCAPSVREFFLVFARFTAAPSSRSRSSSG